MSILKKALVAAALGAAAVLCAMAVLWSAAPDKPAAPAMASLSPLPIDRHAQPMAPSQAAPAAPDAGDALPFTVHKRWRQAGASVVALVQSNRVFEARDGEVVAGSYLMTSDSERLTFTHLQTGRVHVLASSEDCQEVREPSPPAGIALLASSAPSPTGAELTDAERDAQQD